MAQLDTPRDAPDGQTELKKRARRRLVGAAALALLAAIILPMVMDQEPRQPAQDIQIRIPSQDAGGFTSRILPSAKPTSTPLPPSAPTAETKVESLAPAKADNKAEVKVEAKPAESARPQPAVPVVATEKTAAVAKSVDKPPEKAAPAAKPVEKPSDKTTEKAAAHKADEARAMAALGERSSEGPWIVQLGAYKEVGNVKVLAAKLKEMGVATYTEKFESPQGPRIRVRAGPFASHEAALRAQARIKKIGVDGTVAQK